MRQWCVCFFVIILMRYAQIFYTICDEQQQPLFQSVTIIIYSRKNRWPLWNQLKFNIMNDDFFCVYDRVSFYKR